jgi:hypothetical protein
MSQSSSRLSRGSTGSSRDSNRSLYNLEQIILDVERAVQQARLNRNLDIQDINDLERQVRELTNEINELRREVWKTPINSRQTSPEPSFSEGYSSRSESQASTGRNPRNYSRNYSSFGSNKKMESRLKRDLRQLMLI